MENLMGPLLCGTGLKGIFSTMSFRQQTKNKNNMSFFNPSQMCPKHSKERSFGYIHTLHPNSAIISTT